MAKPKKRAQKPARSTRSNKQLDNSFGALLVKKTLCRRPTYRYLLSAADLGKLAPHYKLLLEPDDAFNVIGSKSQLGEVLDAYRDNDRKGVLSLVLHVAPLHWAAMVVHGRQVYFADSLDYEMLSEYDEALKQRPELHLSDYSWKQQNDGHNCGFWALMNAEAIRRQIHDYGPNSGCFPCVLPSISSGWQASFFAALRRDMAKKVEEHDTDGGNRAVVQKEDEPSNSSETVPSAKVPAVAQRRKAKAPKEASTKTPANKQTKRMETRATVVSQAKSRKRKSELVVEEAESPRKKQKGQAEKNEFETSDEEDDDADDDKSGYIQCNFCSKFFSTRKQLANHKRNHAPRNFKCEYCDYKTNFRRCLDTHMARKHPDPNPLLQCRKCRKIYKYLGTLNRHMKKCLGKR